MSDHDDEQDNESEWEEKKDLTRIEDLSEFLHVDDPEVEEALKQASDDDEGEDKNPSEEDLSFGSDDDEASKVVDLGELEDDENADESDGFPPIPSDDNADNLNAQEETDWGTTTDFQSEPLGDNEDSDEDDAFGSSSDFTFDNSEDFAGFEDSSDSETETTDEDFGFNSEDETDPAFDTSDFTSSSFDDEQGEDNQTFNNDEDDDDEDTSFASFDDSEDEAENAYDEDNEEQTEFATFDDSKHSEEEPQSFSGPEPEAKPEEESEPVQLSPPPGTMPVSIPAPSRENFQDLRDFGNAISYGMVKTGGNPPYTLILRNIKYHEDAEDIMILLREHGLVSEENEEITEQGLQNGHLLISQISEYSAIYLAHRMRRFDVEIRIGLSEQLHPSKSYTQENKGLVSKYNLRQDRREAVEMQKSMVAIEDIIMATTSGLEGYDVIQYIKVLSAHHLISELELQLLHEKSQLKDHKDDEDRPKYAYQNFSSHEQEDIDNEDMDQAESEDGPMQQYGLGLEDIYNELAEELRNLAFKNEANAIVGLSYSISPVMMPSLSNDQGEMHYKITCTGNAVWISDRP